MTCPKYLAFHGWLSWDYAVSWEEQVTRRLWLMQNRKIIKPVYTTINFCTHTQDQFIFAGAPFVSYKLIYKFSEMYIGNWIDGQNNPFQGCNLHSVFNTQQASKGGQNNCQNWNCEYIDCMQNPVFLLTVLPSYGHAQCMHKVPYQTIIVLDKHIIGSQTRFNLCLSCISAETVSYGLLFVTWSEYD